ncbi:MAG: hypothetical protein M1817_000995 [Caeruleum heppii]|nr:MAG: hypothetical protein M1817_000995 [Caeruleum heppii]
MAPSAASVPLPLLESLISHTALPPKLPGEQEDNLEQVEDALASRLLEATRAIGRLTLTASNADLTKQWDDLRMILQSARTINAGRKLDQGALLKEFQQLSPHGLLMVHVAEQNAALLFRRQSDQQGDHLLIDAFEVSATSEQVLAAKGALQWDFPGSTVAVPYAEFADPSFQHQLAAFLDQAGTESIKRFAARAQKAGTSVVEPRDTVNPCLITQMLITLIETMGKRIFSPRLRKRIHDDVCWSPGPGNPWRRSAYWLILRVGIQGHLYRLHGPQIGRIYYKYLMCQFLAHLLEESLEAVDPERMAFLNAKFTRRIAKLELVRTQASSDVRAVCDVMASCAKHYFHRTTHKVRHRIESVWHDFKESIRRPVPHLPRYAHPRNSSLALSNCGPYLNGALAWARQMDSGVSPSVVYHSPTAQNVSSSVHVFANLYFDLSDDEEALKTSSHVSETSNGDPRSNCILLAEKMATYLGAVGNAYDGSPEQKSVMLLTLMEMWMLMDQCAVRAFELLKEYMPGIASNMFTSLHVPYFHDMCRLHQIEVYIREREHRARNSCMTIFEAPAPGCYAVRYVEESGDAPAFLQLQQRIETAAEQARQRKEREWEKLSTEYRALERSIAESACVYTTADLETVHDDIRCTKCYLRRQAKRKRISINEDPLPSDPVQIKAVLFELRCPEAFRAYRDMTWKIIGTVACEKPVDGPQPKMQLCDYPGLQPFSDASNDVGVSLASTKKSFLTTHYRHVGFPVPLESVCRRNPLAFTYYDAKAKVWLEETGPKLTFAHHCQMILPAHSDLSSLQGTFSSAVNSSGPSSYQVIASQTRCPPSSNVHAYMAFQTLLGGSLRRWISILVELASSNLNLSNPAITILITRLASQAGPAHASDPLRRIHGVFRDESFCNRLVEQIDRRLDRISFNWRETEVMESLLALIMRLCSLVSDPVVRGKSHRLIDRAREITLRWIRQLRSEIHQSRDAESSQRCSRYAFLVSLLHRRTFFVEAEDGSVCAQPTEPISPPTLSGFIESSICLQDNLDGDPAALPSLIKNAMIHDLKMVRRMRSLLVRSLQASPGSLESAVDQVWPQSGSNPPRHYSGPIFFQPPHEWWIRLIVQASPHTRQQVLDYHLLLGHLQIDGQPLGRLPAKYREMTVLTELFGRQRLLTYPSARPGMAHAVAFPVNGHEIHLGFRDGRLVVQAWTGGSVLELVPASMFRRDLPASLVEDCAHWLDLGSAVVEVRRRPDIWRSKASNWLLDVHANLARRRNSSLIDPHSPLAQQIQRIFDHFEDREQLTVYQPQRGPLSVELRRLELAFFVNHQGHLESRQLQSEIDPEQDPGTWYGLRSQLVLRDICNPEQRSILVRMGNVRPARRDIHVDIVVDSPDPSTYGRFVVNKLLGRLECAPEPVLFYMKAQLHAYTSFALPDPLTGLTGTEEALHFLRSGLCQPWAPLNARPLEILESIAKLTPRRQYYPSDLRQMQQVSWDAHLTTTIQHDALRSVVQDICEKSRELSIFDRKAGEISADPASQPAPMVEHLSRRSHARRKLYQRSGFDNDNGQELPPDQPYSARHYCHADKARQEVFECVSLLRDGLEHELSTFPPIPDFATMLQSWRDFGGCDHIFDKVLISDHLEIDLSLEWGPLVRLCSSSGRDDKHRLMFLFALLSFGSDAPLEMIRFLIAFAVLKDLKSLQPPAWPSYVGFRHHEVPSIEQLMPLIPDSNVPSDSDDEDILPLQIGPKLRRQLEAKKRAFNKQQQVDRMTLCQFILEQWPCDEPSMDGVPSSLVVDLPRAKEALWPEWRRLTLNMELSKYVESVQQTVDRYHPELWIEPPDLHMGEQGVLTTAYHGDALPDLSHDLLRKACRQAHPGTKPTPTYPVSQVSVRKRTTSAVRTELRELQTIVDNMTKSQSTVSQQYGQDLIQSLEALRHFQSIPESTEAPFDPVTLDTDISFARSSVEARFETLTNALARNDVRASWLKDGGLWPAITPITLLEQLRSTSAPIRGDGMKDSLMEYALSITRLQWLLRIQDAARKNRQQVLEAERTNRGHMNWQPQQHPDWLLLEIEANILIRPDQVDVALATIAPRSKQNSVLQMNMGQGKTSCIIPMVAAVLADAKHLVRVIVPKSLLLQTAQLLQARLGGLVGRQIWHVPFSRKTPTTIDTIKSFSKIHGNVRQSQGVMVALPEHLLSFRLSGLQRLSDQRLAEASEMVRVQDWLSEVSRDVLDECDFTLAVRTQMIYPSGSQTTVDGHPHRWETVEAMLRLVKGHLWKLQHDFPHSIEVMDRAQAGFPVVFFLRPDVEGALITRLINDIVAGQMSTLPMRDCSPSHSQAVRRFLTEAQPPPSVTKQIRRLFPDRPANKQILYLLRGLLVHRILLLTLKKRWNVQYGLHPNRDPVAVPFHAKGVPSDQAEWGHPDVAILFTCLSFYYRGLDLAQLRQSLEHVLKSDDPAAEYDNWTHEARALPDALRDWSAINLEDERQSREIWQHLSHRGGVIDHFLNHFVFPKHAKQSQLKLQASGWDLPLISMTSGSEDASASTTGFSGTNDNRTMLPLTIRQDDLPRLSHTNAEVLTYLLQPRNRQYVVAADRQGRHISEIDLLRLLRRRSIRMLIDAGAQILEMDNLALAKAWLEVDNEALAAIYFDEENKAWALYRHGGRIPLLASPFADNLENCLVYLDEAHTRGTDLKMPANARGTLTLGLGQTKDHTVQSAMRLRQLATTQSIEFVAPPEVHQSILDLCKMRASDPIDSHHVVRWLLEQTRSGIVQMQPLYYAHGANFCRRTQAVLDHPNFLDAENDREAYLRSLRQSEHQTLEALYQPRSSSKPATSDIKWSPRIAAFMKELNRRRRGFQDHGQAVHASALQEVEQEREVAFEVEAVRDVQKPHHYSALSFRGLEHDIRAFVDTGRLAADSRAYELAFALLRRTDLGRKHGIRSKSTSGRLFVSKEFSRTVNLPEGRSNDDFLRPVSWVIWSEVAQLAMIIIPEEAEAIIPLLRQVKKTPKPTYLLTYAAPVTRKMVQFDQLDFYTMPALPQDWKPPNWLTTELGLFAGRLYFDFDNYTHLHRYLGLGAVDDAVGITSEFTSTLTDKPLTFLQEWMAVRRKGQDFSHSPMGLVCQGKTLTVDHPLFAQRDDGERRVMTSAPVEDVGGEDDGGVEYCSELDDGEEEEEEEGLDEARRGFEEEEEEDEESVPDAVA